MSTQMGEFGVIKSSTESVRLRGAVGCQLKLFFLLKAYKSEFWVTKARSLYGAYGLTSSSGKSLYHHSGGIANLSIIYWSFGCPLPHRATVWKYRWWWYQTDYAIQWQCKYKCWSDPRHAICWHFWFQSYDTRNWINIFWTFLWPV